MSAMRQFQAHDTRDQAMVNVMAAECRISGWCKVRMIHDAEAERIGAAVVNVTDEGLGGVFQDEDGALSCAVRWPETKDAIALVPLSALTVVAVGLADGPGRVQ